MDHILPWAYSWSCTQGSLSTIPEKIYGAWNSTPNASSFVSSIWPLVNTYSFSLFLLWHIDLQLFTFKLHSYHFSVSIPSLVPTSFHQYPHVYFCFPDYFLTSKFLSLFVLWVSCFQVLLVLFLDIQIVYTNVIVLCLSLPLLTLFVYLFLIFMFLCVIINLIIPLFDIFHSLFLLSL